MKNFIGAIMGVIVGSYVIATLIPITPPSYPNPFDSIWILLAGSQALQLTGQQLLVFENVHWYIVTWLLVGIVLSVFSSSKWGSLRTAFWVGVIIGVFSLISRLLLNPAFWMSETRNWELLIQFITSILTSFLSLTTSIPLTILIMKIREKSEPPVPDKIETICECGAVFKSRPMICSECGKYLNEQKNA